MPKAKTLEQKKIDGLSRQEEIAKRMGNQRSSFNGTDGKLKINKQIEGYHLHILNDYPGRIDQALATGYEFVSPEEVGGVTNNVVSRNTDIGQDKVRFCVGVAEGGGPLYAYLMKIKQEWYDEDQAKLASRNDMIDKSIRQGRPPGASQENFYTPKGGIKIN